MLSEIVRVLSDTVQSIGDYLTNLLYTDDNNFSLLGSILLVFCGISFSLFLVFKIFKFFNIRYKNTDVVDKLSNEEKIDDVVNDVHIEHDFYCVYCGSVTSSNKHNCRNCGSDEFKKG